MLADMHYGDRIKAERDRKGLTQPDLARMTGLSQQAISKLERGLTKNPESLDLVAQALDVPEAWLRYGVMPDMSQMEMDLLSEFRSATPQQQEEIRRFLSYLKTSK